MSSEEAPTPEAYSRPLGPKSYTAAPPPGNRSKNAEYQSRMRQFSKFKFNDLENIPILEVDDEGFAMKPPPISKARKKRLTPVERKVYFVLMWNHSAGNVTLSCQCSGATRADFDKWKAEDPVFCLRLVDAQKEVADRAQFRLAQRMGLVRMPKDVAVHDTALFAYVKRFCPGMSSGDVPTEAEHGTTTTQESGSNVPRPAR